MNYPLQHRSDHILLLDNGIQATDNSQQWLEQFPARNKTTAKYETNELRINDISKSQQLRLEDENEALLQTMNSDQFYLLQFPSYCLLQVVENCTHYIYFDFDCRWIWLRHFVLILLMQQSSISIG